MLWRLVLCFDQLHLLSCLKLITSLRHEVQSLTLLVLPAFLVLFLLLFFAQLFVLFPQLLNLFILFTERFLPLAFFLPSAEPFLPS